MLISDPPKSGDVVRVRQRHYLVEDVVPPPGADQATLVRMSCLDDDAQGTPLDVLWEKEVDPEIQTAEAWQSLAERGFDPPRLFSAYLHTLRWNCVTATDPKLFQSPFRAGIKIDAYQLEPLRKALLLPRVNLFIADDVGLGKTIEAGLIARELLLRKKVQDIVVACPPSMLLQWKDELEIRFGLMFKVLDKEYFTSVRQERGFGVNPWTTHSMYLVSHRLLIDETYAGPLRDWLGDMRPGSLLILDEAHHAAPSSGTRYAIDSKITRAARDIAPRFEHRLFLSATPHNGHSNSFSALLEILDPQRFFRGEPVLSRKLLDQVMVRRLKEDIREIAGGFPKRVVRQIDINGLPEDAPELKLSRLLDQYRQRREERLAGMSKRQQAASGLLIIGLQKRLLSSIEAFARTLRVHRRTVQRQWDASLTHMDVDAVRPKSSMSQLSLLTDGVDSDDDRATLSEDELHAEEDAAMEAATRESDAPTEGDLARRLFADEQLLLSEMTEIAEANCGLPDARVIEFVNWLRQHMCPDLPPLGKTAAKGVVPRWNDTRVILFTEYDDTKRYLREQLEGILAGTDRAESRIAVFHGPTPPAEREQIKRAFNADPKKHPVRILIATDAAREGLNLQAHCWNLFHFDVPWNPSRMEQRNGRIDRKLQGNPDGLVFCHYFIYHQRLEDRVLQVLVRKTENIKRELGSLAQVVESRLTKSLLRGIRHSDVEQLERELEAANLDPAVSETVQAELDQVRDRRDQLVKQVDHLRSRLDASKKWINLSEDHFRAAISCSLELLGAEPLQTVRDGKSDLPLTQFRFPALDQRAGADSTWMTTMDTLRAPRERDQKPWEWRRESPIRDVVFEDTGTMTDEVVHLHLEHRIVQRLLGRFRAQGFILHDLSRACLAQTKDAIPRVVLIGRLCLYGPQAARLHEELIPVAARWVEPSQRKQPLGPYGREAELKTIDLLEAALLPQAGHPIADPVQQRLQLSAPQDVQELLPHLEERGQELAAEATKKLLARGVAESEDMRQILIDQRKRVVETAEKHRSPQLTLAFDEDEKRQLESNQRHWDKRLLAIERELLDEPERIRNQYQVQAMRIQPVGLVYLWPVTG